MVITNPVKIFNRFIKIAQVIKGSDLVNCADEEGETPLMVATAQHHGSVARFLRVSGAGNFVTERCKGDSS